MPLKIYHDIEFDKSDNYKLHRQIKEAADHLQ